jgi:hypothetical protein
MCLEETGAAQPPIPETGSQQPVSFPPGIPAGDYDVHNETGSTQTVRFDGDGNMEILSGAGTGRTYEPEGDHVRRDLSSGGWIARAFYPYPPGAVPPEKYVMITCTYNAQDQLVRTNRGWLVPGA